MFGLGETKIKERRYYPMVVSEEGTEERMSPGDSAAVWAAFDVLPQEKKDVLLSAEISRKIKSLEEKFKLNELVTGTISLAIRKIFFGEIILSDAEEKIRDTLGERDTNSDQAKKISQYIQEEILTIKPKPKKEEVSEEEKKQKAALVRMPLLQALSQYEQLGNQLITRERIKIKSQSEPVRPSLLYWIKYYRDELGVGHHNSMERGNFLFRSENGKRLSPEERERVNLVLKSVEENFPLEIDAAQNIIVFPVFVAPRPMAQPSFSPQTEIISEKNVSSPHLEVPQEQGVPAREPAGTLSFSSKHVLPAEREREEATPSQNRAPAPQTPPVIPKSSVAPANPFHIHPVSTREK